MAVHQTCRPRAIQTARELERLPAVLAADVLEPDQDHIKLNAEHVRMDDRNDQEMYVLHPECYRRLTGGWMEPA
jgi:hypothetical protein